MWDFAFDTDSDSMESISESDKLALASLSQQPFSVN